MESFVEHYKTYENGIKELKARIVNNEIEKMLVKKASEINRTVNETVCNMCISKYCISNKCDECDN